MTTLKTLSSLISVIFSPLSKPVKQQAHKEFIFQTRERSGSRSNVKGKEEGARLFLFSPKLLTVT